jgi:hypothetical protein
MSTSDPRSLLDQLKDFNLTNTHLMQDKILIENRALFALATAQHYALKSLYEELKDTLNVDVKTLKASVEYGEKVLSMIAINVATDKDLRKIQNGRG